MISSITEAYNPSCDKISIFMIIQRVSSGFFIDLHRMAILPPIPNTGYIYIYILNLDWPKSKVFGQTEYSIILPNSNRIFDLTLIFYNEYFFLMIIIKFFMKPFNI